MQLTNKIDLISKEFDETSHKPVNINHVIQEVIRSKRDIGDSEYIDFDLDLSPEIPFVNANRNEIEEIVKNLISNAIRAIQAADTPFGTIKIRTDLRVVNNIEYIETLVEDDGCGIPNEYMHRIFNRNFSNYEGGTGMGLFLTRQIVQFYGGKINLQSTVGKGTMFQVLLPRKRLEV
jgi:signal transduction histidine kinase